MYVCVYIFQKTFTFFATFFLNFLLLFLLLFTMIKIEKKTPVIQGFYWRFSFVSFSFLYNKTIDFNGFVSVA